MQQMLKLDMFSIKANSICISYVLLALPLK